LPPLLLLLLRLMRLLLLLLLLLLMRLMRLLLLFTLNMISRWQANEEYRCRRRCQALPAIRHAACCCECLLFRVLGRGLFIQVGGCSPYFEYAFTLTSS
jgi:hypothetical protein